MRTPLKTLANREFDVVIVGAGINGSAISNQLVRDGFSVLVVEKDDFATGATSKSARILHCGLRHLAPEKKVSEFIFNPASLLTRLKNSYEMARAQVELKDVMPQRLRKMDLALPIFKGDGYSGWHVDLGARLIGLFNGGKVDINYRRWRKPSQSTHPFARRIEPTGRLLSIVEFDDWQFFWPERIALDHLFEAQRNGAVVRNLTEVTALSKTQDDHWLVEIRDTDGSPESVTVKCNFVLNLAGPWVDEILSRAKTNRPVARRVKGIKGVHLLVRLPSEYAGAGLVGVNSEHEPFFCLPSGDFHYVGPTETVYEGSLDRVVAEDEDIEFILAEAKTLMPYLELSRSDIVLTWAGVRPITHDPARLKGQRLPYGVVHDHASEGLPNLISVTWGIIVTHLGTARNVVKLIQEKTKSRKISAGETWNSSEKYDSDTDFKSRIDHAIDYEFAFDLQGVLISRTGILWTGLLDTDHIEYASMKLKEKFGWTDTTRKTQIDIFLKLLKENHTMDFTDAIAN